MIKANELRIGNWVQIKEGYCKVRTIEDEDGIFAGVVSNDNDSVWDRISIAYSQPIEPIPLTPEILEKAGFEKEITTGKSWANDGDEIVSYKNKKGNMRIQDNLVFYSISTRLELIKNDLKYLHQLQNLYFALTGTELNIEL